MYTQKRSVRRLMNGLHAVKIHNEILLIVDESLYFATNRDEK